jgi:hypothetical protein
MIYSYKKYIAIAVIGALIIGLAAYLFLSNFLERVNVLVLSRDMETGEIVTEADLDFKEYYKNALPEGHLVYKEDAIQKSINLERKKGDFLRADMFEQKESKNILTDLMPGESIVAINIGPQEKIIQEISPGDRITIVSAEKDSDLADSIFSKNIYTANEDGQFQVQGTYAGIKDVDYMKNSTFDLSENITMIHGQILIKDLLVLQVKEDAPKGGNILVSGAQEDYCIYVKCLLVEAPMLAKIIQKNNYKIVLGKN